MALDLVNITAGWRAACLTLGGLAALLLGAATAHADDCEITTSAAAVPDFSPCAFADPQLDLDAIAAQRFTITAKKKQSDGTPWIEQSTAGVPLTVTSSDGGVSMRTSIADWRDYNVREAMRSIDSKAPVSSLGFELPKAPAPLKTPLDVWSSVDVQGYHGIGGESVRAGVGADYKLTKTATVGVTLEHGKAELGTGSALDSKMAAYVALHPVSILTFDARTEWQTGNADFAAAAGAAQMSTFSFSPRIDHSFALDDGKTIEPFVSYKHQFDLGSSAEVGAGIAASQSAGAGVTFTDPNSYSLSLTTDLQGIGGSPESKSLNSSLRLKVPID
jgi:hypothetical protein